MEASLEKSYQAENDEEYVLLDLENVCLQADIPANAPYTLSGLDTLNPTLTIGSRLKLIGEYEETVGTCILFSQRDEETRHVASVHKVLKFRLEAEVQSEDAS
ncbi:general transcription factor 3C polypeptide 6-like isoform X2 [Phalaenopsis equestris]|uniref:general transcription factor 3C polypeptide 6-like isoform X2 n=1 Tax=Phalaenopsis equestris TaxID=78828 RepID=UPI0009E2FD1A|nr:general transcription factor 3C polypeptide 6-like isoform X2 [Phalaenopsis equestris]